MTERRRLALTPHRDSPPSPLGRLEVVVERTGTALTLNYRLFGHIDRICIPAPRIAGRKDGLWRHTCMEVFVKGDQEGYLELNASPSSEWATYRFDGYRAGMVNAAVEPEAISLRMSADTLELGAAIDLGVSHVGHWKLGLSAVIEDTGGQISHWALAHPSDKPDFHHPDSFILDLP